MGSFYYNVFNCYNSFICYSGFRRLLLPSVVRLPEIGSWAPLCYLSGSLELPISQSQQLSRIHGNSIFQFIRRKALLVFYYHISYKDCFSYYIIVHSHDMARPLQSCQIDVHIHYWIIVSIPLYLVFSIPHLFIWFLESASRSLYATLKYLQAFDLSSRCNYHSTILPPPK